MIRVGAVDIDTSHPKSFGALLQKSGDAKYAAVYNSGFRDEGEVEGFMKMFGVEKRCETLEELADCVDIGFIHSCNWDKHAVFAGHFIKAGKPVFIDKPLCGNPADCAFFEKSALDGAVILGSSSARYAREVEDFKGLGDEEKGSVLNVFGTCGVDEFNYGIHIVEAIGGILGSGARSARFCARAARDGKICETYSVTFPDGRTAVYNNFTGTWQPFDITAMTTAGTFNFRIDSKKLYAALLEKIIEYMRTGSNRLAPVHELTESVKIMLAGKISRERGGEEVEISSIPPDYAGFDGKEFEQVYAENAKKIFTD